MNRKVRIVVVSTLAFAMVFQLALFFYYLQRARDRAEPLTILVSPEIVMNGSVGRQCIFNVTVKDEGGEAQENEPVTISAIAPGAGVEIEPKTLNPGGSGRVVITPGEGSRGRNLTVSIIGKRSIASKDKVAVTIMVDIPQE